jgi:two-component system chemotaxis response regulator CheY
MCKCNTDILIVDDSYDVLERLTDLLTSSDLNKKVKCFSSALEALIQFKDSFPSIIILDINLPGLTGIQMMSKVRNMKITQPVFIVFTNTTISSYKRECLNIGADYFLDKSKDFLQIPIIIKELEAAQLSAVTSN